MAAVSAPGERAIPARVKAMGVHATGVGATGVGALAVASGESDIAADPNPTGPNPTRPGSTGPGAADLGNAGAGDERGMAGTIDGLHDVRLAQHDVTPGTVGSPQRHAHPEARATDNNYHNQEDAPVTWRLGP